MLVSDLITECRAHAHDGNTEISAANMLIFVQSAARDARSSGWVIRLEDDESLTVLANTWEYNVPASFAYIDKLLIEDTSNGSSVYVTEIPRSHWGGDIRINGSSPVFDFETLQYLTVGMKIKVVGQKRPTVYTTTGDTIDPGMEGFMRERVMFFCFRYLGAGLSELARWRQQMSTVSYQLSEEMLKRHPAEFRQLPSSVEVPGRG